MRSFCAFALCRQSEEVFSTMKDPRLITVEFHRVSEYRYVAPLSSELVHSPKDWFLEDELEIVRGWVLDRNVFRLACKDVIERRMPPLRLSHYSAVAPATRRLPPQCQLFRIGNDGAERAWECIENEQQVVLDYDQPPVYLTELKLLYDFEEDNHSFFLCILKAEK